MIFLYTVAIALQPGTTPVLPRLFSLAGLPAIFAFAYFLFFSKVSYVTSDNPLSPLETERPRVWTMAVAEWAIFITTVPWLLIIAMGFSF